MAVSLAAVGKVAGAVLSDERGRKAVGWIVVIVLAPAIVLVAFICALASASAQPSISELLISFLASGCLAIDSVALPVAIPMPIPAPTPVNTANAAPNATNITNPPK